jgi:hypothetical protein
MFTEITSYEDLAGSANIPGIVSFEFVEASNVESFPEYINAENRLSDSIELKPGSEWHIANTVSDSLKYKEKYIKGVDGGVYDFRLLGKAKQDNPYMSALLDKKTQSTFIIRFKQKAGNYKVLGTPTVPVLFSISLDSDTNLYQFEITGQSVTKPPFKSE